MAKLNVYFTVDTESSMAGGWLRPEYRPIPASRHVFCRIGGEDFGIGLLTKVMGEFGFRGTYFVETLATWCLGDADTASIFDFLLAAEQDVQLHIHPTFWYYAQLLKSQAEGREYTVPQPNDFIGRFARPVQMELLGESLRLFERFAGRRPAAFRAGCFAGSRSMMASLRELGIGLDSSFNPCFHADLSFPGEPMAINAAQKIEGVWELPVTVARSRLPEGTTSLKFADCTSLSFPELRRMLDTAAAAGQEHFVIVFHSFSAVKSRDWAFTELRPDRVIIRRLEKVFRYLAQHPERFRVRTMGDLADHLESLETAPARPFIADLGLLDSVVRKTVQLVNRAYWV